MKTDMKPKKGAGQVLDSETGKPVKVEVQTKAAKGKQLSLVPKVAPVATLNTKQMAAAIEADMLAYETLTRASAFVALRVGLRLAVVRDQGKHGELGAFIEQHLARYSRRTLTNYMQVADAIAKDMEWTKEGALSNMKAVEAVIDGNLEALANPQSKLTGVMAKVSAWVDGRGLTDIYRAIAAEATDRAAPPTGKRKKIAADALRAQELAEAEAMLKSLVKWNTAKHWQRLGMEDLETLRTLSAELANEVPAFAASVRATRK